MSAMVRFADSSWTSAQVRVVPTTEVGDLSFDHLVGAGELSPSVPAMLAVPVRRQSSREHQTSV